MYKVLIPNFKNFDKKVLDARKLVRELKMERYVQINIVISIRSSSLDKTLLNKRKRIHKLVAEYETSEQINVIL